MLSLSLERGRYAVTTDGNSPIVLIQRVTVEKLWYYSPGYLEAHERSVLKRVRSMPISKFVISADTEDEAEVAYAEYVKVIRCRGDRLRDRVAQINRLNDELTEYKRETTTIAAQHVRTIFASGETA